jgi:hypothetical protein
VSLRAHALASAFLLAFVIPAQAQTPSASGRFIAHYGAPTNKLYTDIYVELKDSQALEELVDSLNAALALPSSITIAVEECGETNAFYDPERQRVSLCYELMWELASQFTDGENLEELFVGTFVFVLLHELGHALVHVLDLPITGREEDAVDQLATLLLLDGSEEGETAVASAAVWFALNAESEALDALAFADEHSVSAQRFYNMLCWLYGQNPEKQAELVLEGYLPEDRAVRCPEEYGRLAGSWEKLLGKYRKE